MNSLKALAKISEVKKSPEHTGNYRPSVKKNIAEYIISKHVRHVGVQIAKQLSNGGEIDHSQLIGKMFRSILRDAKRFSMDLPDINAGREEAVILHQNHPEISPRSEAASRLSVSAFQDIWEEMRSSNTIKNRATDDLSSASQAELEARLKRLEELLESRTTPTSSPPTHRVKPSRKQRIMHNLLKPFGCNNRRGAI